MRYYFLELKDIGKGSDIKYTQKVKFFIDGIKANNYEMRIGKVSLMNNKETGGMTIDFEKAVILLKIVWLLPISPTLIYQMLTHISRRK